MRGIAFCCFLNFVCLCDAKTKLQEPSLLVTFVNWLNDEWVLHSLPHHDPCMGIFHERGVPPKCIPHNLSQSIDFDLCRGSWAHRVAVRMNECSPEPLPIVVCGNSSSCRADRSHDCIQRYNDESFCHALLSPYDPWSVEDCEQSWSAPTTGYVQTVDIECARWIAAYGCQNVECGCVTIDHISKNSVSTVRCIMYPQTLPQCDVPSLVLLVGVWGCLVLQHQSSSSLVMPQ